MKAFFSILFMCIAITVCYVLFWIFAMPILICMVLVAMIVVIVVTRKLRKVIKDGKLQHMGDNKYTYDGGKTIVTFKNEGF